MPVERGKWWVSRDQIPPGGCARRAVAPQPAFAFPLLAGDSGVMATTACSIRLSCCETQDPLGVSKRRQQNPSKGARRVLREVRRPGSGLRDPEPMSAGSAPLSSGQWTSLTVPVDGARHVAIRNR